MIRIKAINLTVLKTKVDDQSLTRSTEHGCRSYPGESNIIDGYFTFSTSCNTTGNNYTQQIQFVEWATVVPVADLDPNTALLTVIQTYPEVMQLDVMVDCDCPAFAYWGHRFNLDQINTSLERSMPWTVNDPDARYSCKHLVTVYNTFFY